jgi:hypothetical protein
MEGLRDVELNYRLQYELGPHGPPDSREKLKRWQNELLQDVLPIAKLPTERFKPSEKEQVAQMMHSHLQSLISKINQIKLSTQFRLLSGQPEVPLYGDHFSLAVRNFPTEKPRAHLWGKVARNPARRLLNIEQGAFSWGAGKWIIKTEFETPSAYNCRTYLYGVIAEGLVTGELARLRQCGYCQVFFIAPQPRVTFCLGHGRLYYDSTIQQKKRRGAKV